MLARYHEILDTEIALTGMIVLGDSRPCFNEALFELNLKCEAMQRDYANFMPETTKFDEPFLAAKTQCAALTDQCEVYLRNPAAFDLEMIKNLRSALRKQAKTLNMYSVAKSFLEIADAHDDELATLQKRIHDQQVAADLIASTSQTSSSLTNELHQVVVDAEAALIAAFPSIESKFHALFAAMEADAVREANDPSTKGIIEALQQCANVAKMVTPMQPVATPVPNVIQQIPLRFVGDEIRVESERVRVQPAYARRR